ncbi:serine hydrolase domain-containing protein [Stenotrophomonas sp. AB1(2024)]|uniref:serine hydrolase domain-containing protein n=1 Tax=Stenotrophomonas sp. AB1(2024) TaxID=3132215 RepID=UPI00309778B0
MDYAPTSHTAAVPLRNRAPSPLLGRTLCTAMALLLVAPAFAADRKDPAIEAALNTGLRPTVLQPNAALPHWSLQARMAQHHVPGVAIAVLRDGKLVHSTGYGTRETGTTHAVNADTLFSVGSVSKVVTAAATLRLAADSKLALDQDIAAYLRSWKVPATEAVPAPQLTLRMLMSHTSGLGVHGFADYLPGEPLPTLLQTLDGIAPAKNKPVRLVHTPGERGDYSGGGVMVEQQVLEDVIGQPLDTIARAQVFAPLGMQRSRYSDPQPGTDNIAKAHDSDGALTALPRGWQSFPEQGASGLWTSANDLTAFVAALTASYRGEGNFLPRAIAIDMMTEVSPSWHGLGPRLDGAGQTRIFHHGGSNDSYRAWIEGYLETGDGFVILTNGENGAELAAEIRNALSDAIGRGMNLPVRTVALDLRDARYADYAGVFERDDAIPMDQRRALADFFDIPALQVKVANGEMRVGVAGTPRDGQVLPLSPNRFVSPDIDGLQIEFHRDARGQVNALSVVHGEGRARYVRKL